MADTDLNSNSAPGDHPTLHGGDLLGASRQFGIPLADWIDLSTGISPFPFPFRAPALDVYQRLPYPDPELARVAADYYGVPAEAGLLATAGTQTVIQALPRLLPEAPVWVPGMGYREHAQQWARAGRLCRTYPADSARGMTSALDMALTADAESHLVIINPNNPTGVRLSPEQLARWADRLGRDRYLIVDEAFVDPEPERGVLAAHWRPNLIVLRSFGKFFGLAGLRLGFVSAAPDLLARLEPELGLWSVNGPAQAIARQALADRPWQDAVRARLQDATAQVADCLTPLEQQFGNTARHTPLFSSLELSRREAERLQAHCARRGILLRVIHRDTENSLVRVGRIDPEDRRARERLRAVLL